MNLPRVFTLLFLSLVSFSLYGTALYIYNDSPYTLNAKIFSKDHSEVASMSIASGHTLTWQDSLFDAKDYTEGPFSVVFTCPNGDEYGTVSSVAQNFTVYAQRSRGPKKCGDHTQPEPHRDYENLQPHTK
ncbi:MAG: hypothetical protein KDK76_05690 [Chlamydiia bacterium]|nr:hypothetical protein [Chlamydiia bacterium]